MAVKAKSYQVTAPYVLAKTQTIEGMRVIGLHAGAPVPPDATPEWIKHHLDNDLIAEVGGEPEPEPEQEPDPEPNKPPQQAAPKSEWVDYAVSRGLDRGEAEAMSKSQLLNAYGTWG